jgi:OFA family oxalate/formate antiporter-like MFS transporter
MILIANLQYGWTLFVNPINKAHGWSIASIQLAFSIFIALETWLTPIHGWIVDSLGERRGAKLVVAAVYVTCVGQAVKWFPDRRGLAVGLTAAGYGAGAALTVVPIRAVIGAAGYEAAFFWFGLVQGAIVFILAWFLRAPDPGEMVGIASPKVAQTARSYRPSEALGTPVFWILYIMFVMVSASGLMATARSHLLQRTSTSGMW